MCNDSSIILTQKSTIIKDIFFISLHVFLHCVSAINSRDTLSQTCFEKDTDLVVCL